MNNDIVLASEISLNFTLPVDYPINADYKSGPFNYIEESFESSVNYKQILIDKYKLPKDKCVAISDIIQYGTARAISDEYFDRKDKLGTSSINIVANKKYFQKLTCWNWAPGFKEDKKKLYRSKLAGKNRILATISIIIRYFNITQGAIQITLDGEYVLNMASSDNRLYYK